MEGASTAFHSDGHHRKEKQKLRGSAKAEIRLAWASIRKNCVLGCAQRQSASSVLSELQEPMARGSQCVPQHVAPHGEYCAVVLGALVR